MERVGKKQPGMIYSSYNEYITSPAWKEKRNTVLKLKPACAVCGRKAQSVHHKTYETITNESFKDLMPICFNCHNNIHKRRKKDDTRKDKKRGTKIY